ncbi:dicarboxylate/amino acid:cation symporter [Jeotgalibacillus soli]|uniref:Sodium:dicarboxylate symporter n=1 Tax=Jeotgalibacillus soli TaxID=889306 RepID=A0A0C2S2L6_9BACL|nr:dicarboxylate/amino acid:cation symporter [Jeotgalibacillus soli]KIL48269.1 sodium:dicarboxylate symporter [Jeotgalibacillus soli]
MKLSTQIFVALITGIIAGFIINLTMATDSVAWLDQNVLTPVGQVFLRLIQFVVVPIVFTSLIIGLTSVKSSAQMARYSAKLVSLYVATAIVALFIGMGMSAILQPGETVSLAGIGSAPEATESPSLINWLVSLVPINPFEALSTANLLQIIFAALLIGIASNLVGDQSKPFVSFIQSLHSIIEKIISIVLRAAPIGIFALIASVIATQGLDLVAQLALYVIGLIAAIFVMIGFYYLALLVFGAKPNHFFRSFSPAFFLAFGTASSNATLPLSMENAEKRYGMPKDLASFSIPFGTALKRDGAAILQGFNALFVAQLFGVDITLSLIVTVFVSALIVSFSTAGVPGAGIIMMTTVLGAAGLPLEGIALVAGVDRLSDGFRTALNVVGNTSNAALLQRWEKRQ